MIGITGKCKEKIKRRWLCLVTVILLFTCSLPVSAATTVNQRENVKAGFFAWDGYHVEDQNGLRSGYGYDFLKMTESYCNWKIDFVGYDKTWADMLTMLDNGEIDLLTSAQKTLEWEEKYDFSKQPIGNSATVLSVRQDETQYIVGDPSTYEGMTVGCLEGSSRNDKFVNFAKDNEFNFAFVVYNSLAELKEALANKEVDGILSTNLRTFNGETVLEEFDPTDYYVIVKKGNTKILNQINHAIDEMNYNTPSWKEKLQNKYFTTTSEENLVFNAEELAYLNQIKYNGTVFTVVTNPDLAPYSSYDVNGKPVGIAPELFSEIADRIGLKYEFVSFDNYEDYNTFVRDGKADIDLTCFHDYGLGAQHGIALTNTYMNTSLAIVTRSTSAGNMKRIAEVEGSAYNTTYSEGLFENYDVVTYTSNEDVINAVIQGKVDAAYQYTYMAQKSVENDARNRLVYSVLPQYQVELCMGINDNLDYRLLSVLNEGIRALSGTFTEHLIQENISNMTDNQGFVRMVYEYPIYVMTAVLTLFLILIAVVITIRKKKQTERKLWEESENSRARTEFFLIISHEIRTPLNAVVSYLRMIREEYHLDKGAEDYLQKAQSAAMQLTEVSDNMQDYSDITLGNVILKDEIIRLKNVILQLDQMISIKAKEKNQNYSFDVSKLTRQYLSGDSLRLTLIFQNILENAVKFTSVDGTIEAKLEEECIDMENVNVVFTCKDSGKGMTKEFTEKINTAFHQSDSSYSRTHGGLGLGLFLTQFFIKKMGGIFTVESKEGEGSLFTVNIPMKCPSIEVLQENGVKCRPIRALVYETDEYNIKMAKEILKAVGVKVDIVSEVEDIYKKIRSRAGGPYAYALCILSVDILEDYMPVVHRILDQEPAMEIIGITMDETQITSIETHSEISHAIWKKNSYFELFNAVITDFGESDENEKAGKDLDYSGIHAMIAEDNPINADILSKILKKENIESTICENGKIALDTFEEAKDDTYQI